jgi:hypothetical protein
VSFVPARRTIVAGGAIAAVIGTIAGALVLIGSPAEQREYRMDERRVHDLRLVADGVNVYWTRRGRLPPSLDNLAREFGVASADPGTGERYAYRPIADDSYELCATFARDSSTLPGRTAAVDAWSHGRGRQCFTRKPVEVK